MVTVKSKYCLSISKLSGNLESTLKVELVFVEGGVLRPPIWNLISCPFYTAAGKAFPRVIELTPLEVERVQVAPASTFSTPRQVADICSCEITEISGGISIVTFPS